ncbi:MAG: protein-disulfide reductase DsbD domain-containing protein [Vicinamibacteraceae bacterium]
MIRRHAATLLTIAVLVSPSTTAAQMRAPKAELATTVETVNVRAGKPATLVLKVTLPPNVHVQSNKPRDVAFFPTALVLTPPPGVTVTTTKYPAAVDFTQEGQDAPLAVFEKSFSVTVTVAVAASAKPGDLVVPGRFDYQACDDKVCYRPVKTDVTWTLTVAP